MSICICYYDVPPGAQEDMSVTGQGQPFSNAQAAAGQAQDVPYATLEAGQWVLDGSRTILPDTPPNIWWSAKMSAADGSFAQPPQLRVSFSDPCTATGLSFVFSPSTGQWCSCVRVRWYSGQTLLAETTREITQAQYVLQQTVDSFDSIDIAFLKTNAGGQFVKLQSLQIGQVITFGAQELESVNLVNELDPTLSTLTADSMQVSICERRGITLLPQQNQCMELYRDGTLLASHYISGSRQISKYRYQIDCQSAIGLLEETFLGGMYNGVSVQTLLSQILSGFDYSLDAAFAGKTVSGYLPICTRRKALQQLCFAIGAAVTTQGTGRIRLIRLSESVEGRFRPEDIFSGAKVESRPRYAVVAVAAHRYTPQDQPRALINEQYINGQNVLFTFSSPHHSYEITGGTILQSGANFVRIRAAGTVTLTAMTYAHSMRSYRKTDPRATLAEQGNTMTVENATLISENNATEALERLYRIAQMRQTMTQEAVVTDQRVGRTVASVNPWGTQINGYLSCADAVLTQNAHVAKITIRGTQLPQESVYAYSGMLYAADEGVIYA